MVAKYGIKHGVGCRETSVVCDAMAQVDWDGYRSTGGCLTGGPRYEDHGTQPPIASKNRANGKSVSKLTIAPNSTDFQDEASFSRRLAPILVYWYKAREMP